MAGKQPLGSNHTNMSLRYHMFIKKPTLCRQLTSLTIEEMDTLISKLEPEWKRREHERLDRPDRRNAIGQGHPYFGSFADLLLLLVLYTRTSCSNVLLGVLFGVSEQTVITLSKRLLPLLQDRFVPNTKLRKKRGRINTLDELLTVYPELAEVISDGSDIKTRRPKRQQKRNYSGKSKRHSKKTVLVVNQADGLIVARTCLRPGSVHDKRLLSEDALYQKLNQDSGLKKRADSAWTGEDPRNGWLVSQRATRGHPLTKQQKRQNRRHSRVRIKVEHAIRRVKVFRRIGEITTFRLKDRMDEVLNAAINLANYKQLIRFPVTA